MALVSATCESKARRRSWRRSFLLLTAGALLAPLLLGACNGTEAGEGLRSALPSVTLPAGGEEAAPAPEEPAEAAPEEEPAEPAPPPEEEPAEPAPPPEEEPAEPAPAPEEEPAEPADESGTPDWLWPLVLIVGLVLVALLIFASMRTSDESEPVPAGQPDPERDRAAQADGKLGWVRANVDEPLVRWRASQLEVPEADRDRDSEFARRWTLVHQRLVTAADELLTMEAGSPTPEVREAASMLRGAAESYRGSLDSVATAYASQDPTRISTANRGFSADTALLDQSRRRFEEVLGLRAQP